VYRVKLRCYYPLLVSGNPYRLVFVDNEQYVYFTVANGFDPAEITARVGVQPTKFWHRLQNERA
jgi:hypothetical protein